MKRENKKYRIFEYSNHCCQQSQRRDGTQADNKGTSL